jgi:hypothetical protein
MVHLRTKFYLSDSEGLLIIAIIPDGNKIALLLCCHFAFDKGITLIKTQVFLMIYHHSSFQDPEVRGVNVAGA